MTPEVWRPSAHDLGILEAVVRARAALELMPWKPLRLPQVERWLTQVARPRAGDRDELPDVRLAVSATADLASLELRATGEAGWMLPWLEQLLHDEGAAREEHAALRALAAYLEPERIAAWIEVHGPALDYGWAFPVERPLVKARATGALNEMNDRLGSWSAAHGIDTCTLLGRSLGRGNPYHELHVPVPSLAAALDAYTALGVPPPPGEATEALRVSSRLSLSVWLTGGGLSKLGLRAGAPTTEQLTCVAHAVGVAGTDPLALLEGTLGGKAAESLELRSFANRRDVQVTYTV